ncbi:hypothetical protein FRB99_004834 [Tulasnella sp. 403]|nr:hypothetical protein FRB99_004834 [Tulasnella sp. 403]
MRIFEEDLEHLLSDLFASPIRPRSESPVGQITQPASDPIAALDALQARLLDETNVKASGGALPGDRHDTTASTNVKICLESSVPEDSGATVTELHNIIQRLKAAVEAAEEAIPSTSKDRKLIAPIPLGLASPDEWETLFQTSIDLGDRTSAKLVLDLMRRSGMSVDATWDDRLLFSYVYANDVAGVDQYIQEVRAGGALPTDAQRHMHIQVLVNTRDLIKAQSLIHEYEAENLVPLEATYRTLMQALFSLPPTSPKTPRYRALAWDLFAHMRYVAYPIPSAETFTTMIHACANAISPSAERALDLFHEMTVERKIQPTVATYNAVILTCARTSKADFWHEALRLGSRLIEEHRLMKAETPEEVGAKTQMQPNLDTFKAMLEAAKRAGDLARARWILAELIHACIPVDEELMAHTFHVYATYRPPFKRSNLVVADSPIPTPSRAVSASSTDSEGPGSHSVSEFVGEPTLVPQTHGDILREADVLLERLPKVPWADVSYGVFSEVEITPNLLNAYLAVQCNHGPLPKAVDHFNSLYCTFRVKRNSQSYSTILDRLALAKGREARMTARALAEPIWNNFLKLNDKLDAQLNANRPDANVSWRRIESIWAKMIHVVSKADDTDRGIALVKEFHKRYPPTAVLPPAPAPVSPAEDPLTNLRLPSTSFPTRASLVAKQPLVRLTSNTQIQDNSITPFLSFDDVETLHHRLVIKSQIGTAAEKASKIKDLRYLTWMCHSYMGHLKRRKEWALRRAKK